MKLFNLFFILSQSTAQMMVGGARDDHNCVLDGGYSWCESSQNCIRPWETECPPYDPIEECEPCPPPLPCPLPDFPELNLGDCKLNNHIDECGCQIACPSYDCSNVVIPDNCVTWYDGCNTCQVRNNRADICTLMYCFQQSEPYCMHFNTDPLRENEICYRFCEDGSQETINRRDGCPVNTQCVSESQKNSVSMISYDSCGSRAMTCQRIGH